MIEMLLSVLSGFVPFAMASLAVSILITWITIKKDTTHPKETTKLIRDIGIAIAIHAVSFFVLGPIEAIFIAYPDWVRLIVYPSMILGYLNATWSFLKATFSRY